MATALIPYFVRYLIARAISNGEDLDYSRLGMMFSDIAATLNSHASRLSGITNADGSLKNFPTTGGLTLVSMNRVVATASQTSFTVSDYDTGTDSAVAFSGSSLIDSNSVTMSSSTTVTLPAQAVSTVVTILIFSTGSGTLTRLADTANAKGASLVGVEDSGAIYTAATVEACLAEVMTRLLLLETNLGTLGNYIKRGGTVAFTADQPMGGHKLTGLAAGTADGDAVRFEQISAAALLAIVSPELSTFYLALTGGTMSGALDMNSQRIKNLPTSTDGADAISRDEAIDIVDVSLPTGSIIPYAGSSAPTGWVLCNGGAYDRTSTTYSDLFGVIGTTYGAGGGGNNFQVPDLRGRTPIGVGTGSGLTARALAASGGEETHVQTEAELAAHTHTAQGGDSGGALPIPDWSDITCAAITRNIVTTSTGSSTGFNVMQPYLAVNFLIRL